MLADADALSSCYGVGEVFLPDSLSTIVELGFTSSIRLVARPHRYVGAYLNVWDGGTCASMIVCSFCLTVLGDQSKV